MQVSYDTTQSYMDTITAKIPKSQMDMLSQKLDTLVDLGDNSYSVNSMMFSNPNSRENSNYGASKNNFNF